MKILGFIPARGGSKGLPGKNKKIMLGKPLIAHTIEAALRSNLYDVVVSSDDEDILEIARQYNVNVVQRPAALSGDLAPTLPVMVHAVEAVQGNFDAVMTLQVTSPLRTVKHINETIELFAQDVEADSLVSVIKIPHKYTDSSIMLLDGKYIKSIDSENLVLRRQEKPTYWARNGAVIYITRINKVGQYIFGGKILPYEMGKLESIDIDDLEDWQMAEAIMMYNQRNYK
ncbi:MAG: acylneuraminate cytidylyltransferase family protein [Flavobacterium sp.]|nr:acylneuraminate cytidylyltransferase family protein [Flavobacterium sp.]